MKRFTQSFTLLLMLCPLWAAACLPPVYETYAQSANSADDAIIGRFVPIQPGTDFIVTSSLRGTIKPGRYHLTASRMGPPEGSSCPFKTGPLYAMPEGATSDQTWVLLTVMRKIDDGTLSVGYNLPYAAQRVGTRLVVQSRFSNEPAVSTDEKKFARWFMHRPAFANSHNGVNQTEKDTLKKWQDAAPAWKKTKNTAR